jgi:hypothetical protein
VKIPTSSEPSICWDRWQGSRVHRHFGTSEDKNPRPVEPRNDERIIAVGSQGGHVSCGRLDRGCGHRSSGK